MALILSYGSASVVAQTLLSFPHVVSVLHRVSSVERRVLRRSEAEICGRRTDGQLGVSNVFTLCGISHSNTFKFFNATTDAATFAQPGPSRPTERYYFSSQRVLSSRMARQWPKQSGHVGKATTLSWSSTSSPSSSLL